MMAKLWRSLPLLGKALLLLAILAILGMIAYFIIKHIVVILVLIVIAIFILYELGWLTRKNHSNGRQTIQSDKTPAGMQSEDENTLQNATQEELQLRRRFPPPYRATDGHNVRSKSELLIDNWLHSNGIPHKSEKRVPVQENLFCDFCIEQGDNEVYIEYWGLKGPEYLEQKHKKQEIYRNHGLQLIEITDKEISTLDDVLARKLRGYGIQIGASNKGYCIRCAQAINLDPKRPYCARCYAIWAEYKKRTYKEKFCHHCGERNEGSMSRPLCQDCYYGTSVNVHPC